MKEEKTTNGSGNGEGLAVKVAGHVDEARDKLRQVASDVQDRYEKISSDVRRGAERAGAEIKKSAGRAGDFARERYEDASDNLRKGYKQVRSEVEDRSREFNKYVKANPGKAVLMAAGLGFVLGLLLRRRNGG